MVPYHLAICEDSSLIREEVCGFCEDILTDHKITYDISSFSSAKDLEAVLNKKKDAFDLLILDIEMDEMTGMELAKKLRAGHNRVSIIFMTGYEDYLLEGYTVQPIYFLLKPVSKEKLESALCLDWEINHTRQTVVLKKEAGRFRSRYRTSYTWRREKITVLKFFKGTERFTSHPRSAIWKKFFQEKDLPAVTTVTLSTWSTCGRSKRPACIWMTETGCPSGVNFIKISSMSWSDF